MSSIPYQHSTMTAHPERNLIMHPNAVKVKGPSRLVRLSSLGVGLLYAVPFLLNLAPLNSPIILFYYPAGVTVGLAVSSFLLEIRFNGVRFSRRGLLIKTGEGTRLIQINNLIRVAAFDVEKQGIVAQLFLKETPVPLELLFTRRLKATYYSMRNVLRRKGIVVNEVYDYQKRAPLYGQFMPGTYILSAKKLVVAAMIVQMALSTLIFAALTPALISGQGTLELLRSTGFFAAGAFWTLLDYFFIYRRMKSGNIRGASTSALILGILQLILSLVVPGILLMLAQSKLDYLVRTKSTLHSSVDVSPPAI